MNVLGRSHKTLSLSSGRISKDAPPSVRLAAHQQTSSTEEAAGDGGTQSRAVTEAVHRLARHMPPRRLAPVLLPKRLALDLQQNVCEQRPTLQRSQSDALGVSRHPPPSNAALARTKTICSEMVAAPQGSQGSRVRIGIVSDDGRYLEALTHETTFKGPAQSRAGAVKLPTPPLLHRMKGMERVRLGEVPLVLGFDGGGGVCVAPMSLDITP